MPEAPPQERRHVRVAIVGAGFGGLGDAIRLLRSGERDLVVLERAQDVGGTWRDNSYPGCACDVPSVLYSFSFAPNPGWTRSFSRQPEIWRYLQDCVEMSINSPPLLDLPSPDVHPLDDVVNGQVASQLAHLIDGK